MIQFLGIFLTIVFGIPSLIAIYKIYSKSIIWCEIDKVNLNNAITKNIPELRISYNQNEISENLILYKGLIYCDGRVDITKQDIQETLKLKLPSDSKWHEFRIIESSPDFKPNIKIEQNFTKFIFDLFKNGEYFYFESVLESKESSTSKIGIELKHRIANLGKIKKRNFKQMLAAIVDSFKYLIYSILLISMSTYIFSTNSSSVIQLIDIDGKPLDDLKYSSKYDAIDSICADYSFFNLLVEGETKQYKIRELITNREIVLKGIPKKNGAFYYPMVLMLIGSIFLFLSFSKLLDYLKNKNLIQIINRIAKEQKGDNKP